MNVRLFIPCSIDLFYPSMGIKTVAILEKYGCNVLYNPEQTCCGKWINQLGMKEFSKEAKQKFIRDHFSSDYIVAPDNTCLQHLIDDLDNYEWTPMIQSRVKHIKNKMFELTDFIVNVLEVIPDSSQIVGNVALNRNTNSLLKSRTTEALKVIFNANPNSKLSTISIPDIDFGYVNAMQSLLWPKLTQRILDHFQEKLQSKYQAHYFIDSDIVSVNYFRKFIAKKDVPLKVLHPLDLFQLV